MKIFLFFFSVTFAFLTGCSGSERFTEKEEKTEITSSVLNEERVESSANDVRLLIDEGLNEKQVIIGSECLLFSEEKKIAVIKPGNSINISANNEKISLRIQNKFYNAEYFQLIPKTPDEFLLSNEMKLRGKLKIINNSGKVMMINSVDIESYLKGVLPREMPLGKENENYEALKAFAICARTYTLQQMNSRELFDLYIDVRDQVYGGVDSERTLSNKAVDETRNLILSYNEKPAKVFYHSTCGGRTEDVNNIFSNNSDNYLSGIEDGNHPYCTISPSFNWKETYTSEIFIERLRNANLNQDLKDFPDCMVENVKVESRYESGRVEALKIDLLSAQTGEKTSVTLKGNNMRWVIRTADNKRILKSIWFDIELDENKNVIITGKGYGHGVGLCQWGAIGQSREGKKLTEILYHYFPGTKISYSDDKK